MGYQIQQTNHSIAEAIFAFPEAATEWHTTSNSILSLEIDSEKKLEKLYNKLSEQTDVIKFHEEDLNDELTTICFIATPEARRHVSHLKLLGTNQLKNK